MVTIPKRLRNTSLRFCKLKPQSKIPLEIEWQIKRNYPFDGPQLAEHQGNLGIVAGYGDVRIIDCDDSNFALEIETKLPKTFTVLTGSGKRHYYLISEYCTNHVFTNKRGEFRAHDMQVVIPDSVHPNKNSYEVLYDRPIARIEADQLKEILKPYITPTFADITIEKPKDNSRSGREFAEVCKLIKKGLTKEQIFNEMQAFSKWYTAPQAYKDLTYTKALATNSTLPNPTSPNLTLPNPTPPEWNSREYLIKVILKRGRSSVNQIKCGIFNDSYYFATTMPHWKKHTAIVTSDRKLYVDWGKKKENQMAYVEIKNEILEDYGLNYSFDFEGDCLDTQMSLKATNDFIFNNATADLKKCFEIIHSNNKKYIWYNNPTTHKIIALDILSTYFLPCFEAKGRTFLEAEKGSGKTRQCQLYQKQACNALMTNDVTKAGFFRLMESTVVCFVIDDFDGINEEQKQDFLRHYKTGYKNSGKTIRVSDDSSRKNQAFRNYGHVILNNTTGLDDISMDRSLSIPLLKCDNKVTIENLNLNDIHWQEISDNCYIAALCHWREVRDAYNQVKSSLKGRKLEVVRPLLALASLFSTSLRREVEKFCIERFNDASVIDKEYNWEYLALSFFFDYKDEQMVRLKEVAEYIFNTTCDEGVDKKKKVHGISVYIGKLFQRLPVFKVVTIHGATHIRLIDRSQFDKYLRVKGWGWVELGEVGMGGGLPQKPEIKEEDVI